MRLTHAGAFLVGHRASILALWKDRWCLPVGGLLVLAGSLARNYDGHDLIREWHVLLHGFGASIANALALYLLFRIANAIVKPKAQPQAPPVPFWRHYLSFLGVFWMTAPMAWLYGIPFERLLDPLDAVRANLWLLAAVSVWRVLLISRVLSVAFGVPLIPVLLITVLFGDVLAVVAVMNAPVPTLDMMGGLRHPPEVQIIANTAMLIAFYGFLSLPVWLISAAIGMAWLKSPTAPPEPERLPPPRAALLTSLGAIAAWAVAAVFAQPSVRLKVDVERHVAAGRFDEALAVLSSHPRREFPPVWDLPPRARHGDDTWPAALDGVRRAFAGRSDVPDWVRQVYADKTLFEMKSRVRAYGTFSLELEDSEIERRLRSASERAPLAPVVRFWIGHDATLDPETRARWLRIADAIEAAPPDQRR